jgi:hypothetical protein
VQQAISQRREGRHRLISTFECEGLNNNVCVRRNTLASVLLRHPQNGEVRALSSSPVVGNGEIWLAGRFVIA